MTTLESPIDITHFAHVPEELIQENRWLVWKYEYRANSKGEQKKTKVPYQSNRPQCRASSTGPWSWSTYAEALECFQTGQVNGIGFALGDGWAGVDLDHCIVDGVIEQWAQEIIEKIDSYTEISPSQTGVKMLTRGTLPPGRRRMGQIEMYCNGRFFTVTGHCIRKPKHA